MSDKKEKVCAACNRLLPISAFRKTRWGGYSSNCNVCQSKKSAATKKQNRESAHIEGMTFPEFDGKSPQEVIQMMARAKVWLSRQGFDIKLSGEFREVKIRPIKFDL